MSFESLSHTPEFELPGNAPPAPADLISLMEECHEGLHKVIVWKMIRRGKYDQIATIICQENPNKKTKPQASPEDICDYCMMCMQYEMDKSDDPGTYKVQILGPPGRGRFDRSKHVDLSGGDGEAHTKTMLSEGELVDQQSQYIGELHSQMIAMHETLHSMVKPLLTENREMMKIVTDASKKNAEIEREKLRFELEMMMHKDQIKQEQQREEMKNERWRETMETVKESGAIEGLMKALHKKLANSSKSDDDDDDDDDEEKDSNKKASKKKSSAKTSDTKKSDKGESKVDKAKRRKKRRSQIERKKAREIKKVLDSGEEFTQEQLEEVFKSSAMDRVKENPLAVMVEILKISIDEQDKWPIIKETLTENQFNLFKKISESENDSEIEKLLKKLYAEKGMRRFFKLEKHLDDDQQKYIEKLLEVAVKD